MCVQLITTRTWKSESDQPQRQNNNLGTSERIIHLSWD